MRMQVLSFLFYINKVNCGKGAEQDETYREKGDKL